MTATIETPRVSGLPFRHVHVYLTLLIPATVLAFWTTWFYRPDTEPELPAVVRIHGILMFAWLIMLIAQAWFIRTRCFRPHRWVGRSSYVIAPIIVLNGLHTIHVRLGRTPESEFAAVVQLDFVTFGILIAFAVTWGLAIAYRRRTPLHVRFIVSTAFAVGPAIVFRILLFWTGLDTEEAALAGNFGVLMMLLLLLIAMDWRRGVKRSPFWVVTVVLALAHIGYWTIAESDAWIAFCRWFAGR